MVSATSTFESLAEAYGAGQVRRKEIYIAEGESRPGFILFAGQDRELEVALDETGTPQFVRISREGSPWKTAKGVRTGLSLEKLQEINGQPFLFFGFEWDLSGLVTSWEGGRLDSHLIIALRPVDSSPLPPELLGEVQLLSDEETVRQHEFEVGSMVVTFSER